MDSEQNMHEPCEKRQKGWFESVRCDFTVCHSLWSSSMFLGEQKPPGCGAKAPEVLSAFQHFGGSPKPDFRSVPGGSSFLVWGCPGAESRSPSGSTFPAISHICYASVLEKSKLESPLDHLLVTHLLHNKKRLKTRV